MDYDKLVEEAYKAKEKSYSPYSKFKVGACLLGKSGTIYHGCNVENAAYGSSICAERTAVVKAVSEGERNFIAIVVVTDSKDYAYPCGECRQVLNEFGPEMDVISAKSLSDYKVCKLSELLPNNFGPKDLK